MEFDSRNEIASVDDSRRLNISLAADSLRLLNATLLKAVEVQRNEAAFTIAEELRKVNYDLMNFRIKTSGWKNQENLLFALRRLNGQQITDQICLKILDMIFLAIYYS